MIKVDDSDEGVLKRFMQEFFPFNEFKKAGIFTKEMKGDYKAQSEKIRIFFGFKTIYEYGAMEFRGHISFTESYLEKHPEQPFITTIKSIYD